MPMCSTSSARSPWVSLAQTGGNTRGVSTEAETGYVVGRNATIESREGDVDRLAADLVRRHVTVIVAVGRRPALAVKAAMR